MVSIKIEPLDFLKELNDNNTNKWSGLHNDLDYFIWVLPPKYQEKVIKDELGISFDEFLSSLGDNLFACSEQTRLFFINYLEKAIYSSANPQIMSVLEDAFSKYMITYPSAFDLKRYSFIIAKSVYKDLIKALNHSCSFRVSNAQDINALADFANIYDKYYFTFYPNMHNNMNVAPEVFIYNIFAEMYHEQFHAIVEEMNFNPHCYKTEILRYNMSSTVKKLLSEFVIKEKGVITKGGIFYENNWSNFEEEIDATLYGNLLGYRKIKDWCKDFDYSKIITSFNLDQDMMKSLKVNQHFKIGRFKEEYKVDYLLHVLDELLPNNTSLVKGILSKMYDENGKRKSIEKLLLEKEMARINAEQEEINDINSFYNELIYFYVKTNPQVQYTTEVEEALSYRVKQIDSILKDIDSINSSTLMGKIAKMRNKHALYTEVKQIDSFKHKRQFKEDSYGL